MAILTYLHDTYAIQSTLQDYPTQLGNSLGSIDLYLSQCKLSLPSELTTFLKTYSMLIVCTVLLPQMMYYIWVNGYQVTVDMINPECSSWKETGKPGSHQQPIKLKGSLMLNTYHDGQTNQSDVSTVREKIWMQKLISKVDDGVPWGLARDR